MTVIAVTDPFCQRDISSNSDLIIAFGPGEICDSTSSSLSAAIYEPRFRYRTPLVSIIEIDCQSVTPTRTIEQASHILLEAEKSLDPTLIPDEEIWDAMLEHKTLKMPAKHSYMATFRVIERRKGSFRVASETNDIDS